MAHIEPELIPNPTQQKTAPPNIRFDYMRYVSLLDDPSLSDNDKRQIIEALWDIVTSFIRLGFGVHPVQQALEAQAECGKHADSSGAKSADPVNCKSAISVDGNGGTS